MTTDIDTASSNTTSLSNSRTPTMSIYEKLYLTYLAVTMLGTFGYLTFIISWAACNAWLKGN